MPRPTQQDFERLLEFRVTLRRFQRWSEDQAQAEGLTHVQHQLLVAVKGHRGTMPPTVGELAGYLLLRPHSTVELVDRAEAAGLVDRMPDSDDGRVVRVRLTSEGDRILQKLTRAHLERLHELATVLDELVTRPGAGKLLRAGSLPQRWTIGAVAAAAMAHRCRLPWRAGGGFMVRGGRMGPPAGRPVTQAGPRGADHRGARPMNSCPLAAVVGGPVGLAAPRHRVAEHLVLLGHAGVPEAAGRTAVRGPG